MGSKFAGKEGLLETLNAVVWVVEVLGQTGKFPQDAEIATNFPSFTQGELLYYLFNLAQYPSPTYIKDNYQQVAANLKAKRDAIAASASIEEVSTLPPNIATTPVFEGKPTQDVLNEINAALLILKKKPDSQEIEAVASLENETGPLFTFAESEVPEGEISPNLDLAAEALLDEGLVKETGEPEINYTQRLLDENYKKQVENKLQKAVVKQKIQQELVTLIDRKLEEATVDAEAAPFEIDFLEKTEAEKIAATIVTNQNLLPEQLKILIAKDFEARKENLANFANLLFSTIAEFSDPAIRSGFINQLVTTFQAAISEYTPNTQITIEISKDFPEIKVVLKNPEGETAKFYYPNPFTPESLAEVAALARKDSELVLKTALAASYFEKTKPSQMVEPVGS